MTDYKVFGVTFIQQFDDKDAYACLHTTTYIYLHNVDPQIVLCVRLA